MTTSDAKRLLRARILDAMRAIPEERRRRGESSVHETLRRWVRTRSATSILVYLADADELSVDPLVVEWIEAGITVAAPRVAARRGEMEAAKLTSLREEDLHRDRYGLRSPPADAPAIPADAFDLVLVPGVAFTMDGARLGRGGGYYDRWLSALPAETPRLGVCHAVQVVDHLVVEPHDRPVHRVVTGESD